MSKRNFPTISQANPSKLSPTNTNTPKTSSAISQYMGALRSPIIKLTTSCKDTTFYVHQVLLIRHSPFLHHVINSAGEDLDRTIDLQAWDIETIGRFVHFLYFDTYEAPKPSPLRPLRGFGKGKGPSADALYDPAHDNESHRSLTQLDESRFYALYPEEDYDYRSVILTHAYLYDLARWFEIESLERITYKRLELILKGFKPIVPHSPLAEHIVGLLYVVYIYKSNVASTVLADPMRRMVSQFVAMNFAAVGCTEEMKELLRQKGELAVDILQEVSMRLDSAEGQLARPRNRW